MSILGRLAVTLTASTSTAIFCAAAVFAQSADDRAWQRPGAILVIDPYEANAIDWAKLKDDRQVKAIIHRAYFGLTPDRKYVERVAKAKQLGLLAGIYLLGRRGDPIAQADALIKAGADHHVTLLGLDIENMEPSSMTLPDAARFIERVHQKTGRYPIFYTNFSTYSFISRHYGASSAFAKTPLWLARFKTKHGMDSAAVWPTYALWQFQSELNCRNGQACFRRVAGTASDMDVNVFRGSEAELRALFGG